MGEDDTVEHSPKERACKYDCGVFSITSAFEDNPETSRREKTIVVRHIHTPDAGLYRRVELVCCKFDEFHLGGGLSHMDEARNTYIGPVLIDARFGKTSKSVERMYFIYNTDTKATISLTSTLTMTASSIKGIVPEVTFQSLYPVDSIGTMLPLIPEHPWGMTFKMCH